MRKIWVIAGREYRAAIQSKAFIITLLLMPVLMGGSILVQAVFARIETLKDIRLAVIDHSPSQLLGKSLAEAAALHNKMVAVDAKTDKQVAPRYLPEVLAPEANIAEQRFALSQRVEQGELEAIVEIGPKVLLTPDNPHRLAADVPEDESIRIQAKSVQGREMRRWVELVLNEMVQRVRLEVEQLNRLSTVKISDEDRQKLKITLDDVKKVQARLPFKIKSLTRRDAQTGTLSDEGESQQFVNLFLPGAMIGLMFMVVMIGATPAMQGIVEEKSQRIAEVLLASVTPFQLMSGKLLGVIGVSLTIAAVYLGGGYFLLQYFGLTDILTLGLIAWFVFNLILALLIFGSLFIAVGAAAVDIKDTQMLMMPIMIFATLPFFAMGTIMMNPNGVVAVVCTFFPFATPMLLTAREAVPPGVPLVQKIAGVATVLTTTLLCVWIAGRIFRVGILLTGRSAKFGDLIRWVWRG